MHSVCEGHKIRATVDMIRAKTVESDDCEVCKAYGEQRGRIAELENLVEFTLRLMQNEPVERRYDEYRSTAQEQVVPLVIEMKPQAIVERWLEYTKRHKNDG